MALGCSDPSYMGGKKEKGEKSLKSTFSKKKCEERLSPEIPLQALPKKNHLEKGAAPHIV